MRPATSPAPTRRSTTTHHAPTARRNADHDGRARGRPALPSRRRTTKRTTKAIAASASATSTSLSRSHERVEQLAEGARRGSRPAGRPGGTRTTAPTRRRCRTAARRPRTTATAIPADTAASRTPSRSVRSLREQHDQPGDHQRRHRQRLDRHRAARREAHPHRGAQARVVAVPRARTRPRAPTSASDGPSAFTGPVTQRTEPLVVTSPAASSALPRVVDVARATRTTAIVSSTPAATASSRGRVQRAEPEQVGDPHQRQEQRPWLEKTSRNGSSPWRIATRRRRRTRRRRTPATASAKNAGSRMTIVATARTSASSTPVRRSHRARPGEPVASVSTPVAREQASRHRIQRSIVRTGARLSAGRLVRSPSVGISRDGRKRRSWRSTSS